MASKGMNERFVLDDARKMRSRYHYEPGPGLVFPATKMYQLSMDTSMDRVGACHFISNCSSGS